MHLMLKSMYIEILSLFLQNSPKKGQREKCESSFGKTKISSHNSCLWDTFSCFQRHVWFKVEAVELLKFFPFPSSLDVDFNMHFRAFGIMFHLNKKIGAKVHSIHYVFC